MSICKVSVIVPVYCAERYIDRCVKSILSQTESNIELLLIDDGSLDRSGNLCDAFALEDTRVRVYHKANEGVSAARNDGIQLAVGKYVAFVDADDYIEPDMLSTLVELAERKNAEISVCGYYIEHLQEQKAAKLCCGDGTYAKEATGQLFQKYFEKDYTGISSMCNKIYLRSFLNSQHIRVDESLQRAEDFWFNFEAVQRATCISVISTPFYHYVQNAESVMHSYRPTQFEDWTRTRKRLLAFAKEHKICLQYSDFYYQYVYNSVLLLRATLQNKERKQAFEIMQNPFFKQAIKQTSGLPLHISVIALCIEYGFYYLAKLLLRIWTICSGEKNV